MTEGGLITAVQKSSPAARAGILPGERLLAGNGRQLRDLIDYHIAVDPARRLRMTLAGPEGRRTVLLTKGEDEAVGLSFATAVFDGIRRCRNRCVFCFVDQLPKGLRPSLYIKDEDYRLSFLQGNYVTLTPLAEEDRDRIVRERLSPLYVSVHATDPEIRGRLLGRRGPAPILPLLTDLVRAGIRFHAQAVICPGWNDGPVLARTIADLAALWPGVTSLAVVPVGLTGHRRGLAPLRPFTREEATALLAEVAEWQKRLVAQIGTRFVFAADEFYLLAEEPIPSAASYEDYPQLENGVGLIRSFTDDFRVAWRYWRKKMPPGRLRVVTGFAAAGMWKHLASLMAPRGVVLEVVPVENRLFGPGITVAGLLSAEDIIAALRGKEPLPTFVPRVAVRRGEDLFLDGMRVAEFREKTQAEVIEPDARIFLRRAARVLGYGAT
ncbi:MAG: DUF512 domain-containing protein [Firmicutes bacterium]|nr:DUF512 domain-containing protein [Bacillota bacterium]